MPCLGYFLFCRTTNWGPDDVDWFSYVSFSVSVLIARSRLVPLVDKAPLPTDGLVTSISLQVENPTPPTAHAPEKFFQLKFQYFSVAII